MVEAVDLLIFMMRLHSTLNYDAAARSSFLTLAAEALFSVVDISNLNLKFLSPTSGRAHHFFRTDTHHL